MKSKLFLLLFVLFSALQAQSDEVKQITNFEFDSRNPTYFKYLWNGFYQFQVPIIFEAHNDNTINIVSLDYNSENDTYHKLRWVTDNSDSNRNPSANFLDYTLPRRRIIWETKRNGNWDLAISELSDSGWSSPQIVIDSEIDDINAKFVEGSYQPQNIEAFVYESGCSIYLASINGSTISVENVFKQTDSIKYITPVAFSQDDLYVIAVGKKSDTLYSLNYRKKNLVAGSWGDIVELVEAKFICKPTITDFGYSENSTVAFEMEIDGKRNVYQYRDIYELLSNNYSPAVYDTTNETSYYSSYSLYFITERSNKLSYDATNYKFQKNDSAFVNIPIGNWGGRAIVSVKYYDSKLVLAPLGNISGDNIYFSIWEDSLDGRFNLYGDKSLIATTIKEIEATLPEKFELFQNYPNPFNPTTKIQFTIPTSPLNPSPYQGEGNRERLVTLKIYDILGNEIATLVNEKKSPGTYEVDFNGEGLTSGIYFYKLSVGKYSETKKMLLMK